MVKSVPRLNERRSIFTLPNEADSGSDNEIVGFSSQGKSPWLESWEIPSYLANFLIVTLPIVTLIFCTHNGTGTTTPVPRCH